MAIFYIWETVEFIIRLSNPNDDSKILEGNKNVIISFGQGSHVLNKEKGDKNVELDVENDIITVFLSQEETGEFKPGSNVIVQINILYDESEERDTSTQVEIKPLDNLYREVMN